LPAEVRTSNPALAARSTSDEVFGLDRNTITGDEAANVVPYPNDLAGEFVAILDADTPGALPGPHLVVAQEVGAADT
jgi:hypothetical protein